MPPIGVFSESPASFFALQVAPLNSSIAFVSARKEPSSGVLDGNSLTSTALFS